MVKPISAFMPTIKPLPSVPGGNSSDTSAVGANFGEIFSNALNTVSKAQKSSEQMSNILATGKIDDLHTVMIEGSKAELALQFTLQVRNKILDAYNEIMRMQM